jgi:basic membrane protein A
MKKRYYAATALICILMLLAFALASGYFTRTSQDSSMAVGFIYSEDESTPYTYNFTQGQRALAEQYGSRIRILVQSNVHGREAEEPIRDLIRKGCRLVFINADTEAAAQLCTEYPDVQFCQVSLPGIDPKELPENYHTFNGEIYQARYAAGVAAGMKLRTLLDAGDIRPEDAKVGYVAANNSAEVVSGYTAFILGVRAAAPEAVMRVRYTGSWSNYSVEKSVARQVIDEGCIVISQHTNTMAPAIACEEAAAKGNRVYHVGYHQSMMDVAPSTALVSLRTNWTPYILSATEAVMKGHTIENDVSGHVHGRDISAGFDQNWVQLLELNKQLAAPGTEDRLSRVIDSLKKGKTDVFRGNYTGVNPDDPADTIDLKAGYRENELSSAPSFRYILQDIITEEN